TVSDVHGQLLLAQTEAINHLDGVIPAYLGRGLRPAAIEMIQNVFHPDRDNAVETADHFVGITKVGAPAPTVRIEGPHVTTVAIQPAVIERRENAEDNLDPVAMLDSQIVGCSSSHGYARQDVSLRL